MNTDLLDRAMVYAIRAHSGVERRGKGFPYIVHPMEAVAIAATMTNDQELLAAAVLHDVVEDTDCTVEDLRREFGERVAALVAAESDMPGGEWHERKQEALDRLRAAGTDAKIVALGDKLSNLRAIARDYAVMGDAIWDHFHEKNPREHAWRFYGLSDALSELSDTEAYREFNRLLVQVFGPRECGVAASDVSASPM